jgi:hypothetical protein
MSRSRCITLALAVAVLVVAVLAVPEIAVPGVLSCAPALVLLGCLWLGRFPGHERLVRWITRRRRPRRSLGGALTPAVAPAPVRCPRGGRLLGSQLAVRPPPAALGVAV